MLTIPDIYVAPTFLLVKTLPEPVRGVGLESKRARNRGIGREPGRE